LNLEAKLQEFFGFNHFRPLQKEIIEQLLAGHCAVGILPTGAGKSLCYQLPALLLPGVTIVISPLISLMKDQTDSLVERGVKALAINSHDTAAEARSKLAALAAGEAKLVFVAPERLPNQAFQEACSRVKVSLLAVDEAHCVSQWGHDFRPEYQQIGAFHAAVGRPPMLALTATARTAVQQDLMQQLGIPDAPLFRASADRPNLWMGQEACATEAERLSVIAHVLRETPGSAVVYVTSRKEAEGLSDKLTARLGEPVGCYHAGMDPEERTAVQNQFMADLVRVVVATNAFGMGIDKPDIRTVIHAGVPDSLEAYFQEIGRAGRDGAPARCLSVLLPGRDVKMREFLVKQSGDPHAWDRFRRMCSYVFLKEKCRRAFLLQYFGEQPYSREEACCSYCHPLVIPHTVEPEEVARTRSRRRNGAAAAGAGGAGGGSAAAGLADTGARQPGQVAEGAAELFEQLKLWRRRKASEMGVPAYIVFGDRDLASVAEAAPQDLMALAACRGVGPTKLKQYGEELLAEVARFAAEHKPAAPKADRSELMARAGALFSAGHTAGAVAAELDRAEATVWQYLVDWIEADATGAWKEAVRHVLSRDDYRAIAAAVKAQEDGRLKPIFDRLEGRFTYEQIRVARAVMSK
jgi:ATP-dependent DNA helicase RecQ